MSATNKSQEIQQLLAAEKRAAETVSEARKRKAKRLRQAKDEALKEIEAYKSEREAQYKSLEQQLLGSKNTIEDSIQIKTEEAIAVMQVQYNNNKAHVLQDVLALFSEIKSDTHKNLYNN